MIDGSGKRNRQLAFELQNLHVCEKCSLVIGKHLFIYLIHKIAILKMLHP